MSIEKEWATVIFDNYNYDYQGDYEAEQQDWNDMAEGFSFPEMFVVTGRYESRYGIGSGEGGLVLNTPQRSFQEFLSKIGKDCDYFKIGWDKVRGNLKVICTHHDGTNYYEIRELTEAGANAYSDWEHYHRFNGLDRREITEKIWNSKTYSKRIARGW